ncbi:VOC family protein [Hamadaea tsunoensis]|uniref:VOC family protein n=1 Tax=Hamadaea tsunoensis TaxID=53368 RepID=UPI00146FB2B6|nr:VOC family protein [Hamadaea tsunoensis]
MTTPDAAASAVFYADLLGWKRDDADVFRHDDRAAAGLQPVPGGPAAWLSYIAADDIDAAVSAAAAAGGTQLSPIVEDPHGGRAAVLRDPAGAVFGIWQRTTLAGAQVAGEPGSVCWTDLATGDRAGAEAFYGNVFEWASRLTDYSPGDNYYEFSTHARAVAGMRVLTPEIASRVPTHWLITFEVQDVPAHAERAVARGANVLVGPVDAGVGVYSQIIDPQGAAFGLIELAESFKVG